MKYFILCLLLLSASCGTSTINPNCGNGVLNQGEQCDDGNNADGDLCNADCTLPS